MWKLFGHNDDDYQADYVVTPAQDNQNAIAEPVQPIAEVPMTPASFTPADPMDTASVPPLPESHVPVTPPLETIDTTVHPVSDTNLVDSSSRTVPAATLDSSHVATDYVIQPPVNPVITSPVEPVSVPEITSTPVNSTESSVLGQGNAAAPAGYFYEDSEVTNLNIGASDSATSILHTVDASGGDVHVPALDAVSPMAPMPQPNPVVDSSAALSSLPSSISKESIQALGKLFTDHAEEILALLNKSN